MKRRLKNSGAPCFQPPVRGQRSDQGRTSGPSERSTNREAAGHMVPSMAGSASANGSDGTGNKRAISASWAKARLANVVLSE